MRTYFISPFLCLLPFLFSCKDNGHHDAGKKYQFALNPAAGAKYYFNINTETVSKVSVNGKEVETNNLSEVGLIYEVVSNTPDSIQIKITYDQLKFNLKSKDGEKEIDAANSGHTLNDQEKQLAAIKGASMNITLNKKGDVLQVAGSKEIADKLISTLHATSAASQAQIREQFNKFIGEDFVKNNLASQFKLFPDTAVSVGNSWEMKNIASDEIGADGVTRYVFDDLDGTSAAVTCVATINTDNKTTIMGSEVAASMNGKQEGRFETDINTGLLMKGETTTSMEGSFQMMGKDIPVSIKMKKNITGKKL